MKIKVLSVILAGILAFILVACGGSGTAGTASDASAASESPADVGGSSEGDPFESISTSIVKGPETYDVGDFSVFIPENWIGRTFPDADQGPDADGNYPGRTDAFCLINGESEDDYQNNPKIIITYNSDSNALTEYDKLSSIENEIIPMDDITINGVQCLTCLGRSNDGYEVIYIILPVTHTSSFQIKVDGNGDLTDDPVISLNDMEVVAILTSITINE